MALRATASPKWPMSDDGDRVGYKRQLMSTLSALLLGTGGGLGGSKQSSVLGTVFCGCLCVVFWGVDTRSGTPDKLSVHTDLCVRITTAA